MCLGPGAGLEHHIIGSCPEGQTFQPLLGTCAAYKASTCHAVMKETLCWPLNRLPQAGLHALEEEFKRFFHLKYPRLKLSKAIMMIGDNRVILAIVDSNGNATALANAIDVSEFSDPVYCSDTKLQPEIAGHEIAQQRIHMADHSCESFDFGKEDEIRRAMGKELKPLGVRETDVYITDRHCTPATEMLVYVFVPAALKNSVQSRLGQVDFWSKVYSSLKDADPLYFLDGQRILLGAADAGSGDADSIGQNGL